MKFGITAEERRKKYERMADKEHVWRAHFAWKPVKLIDGRRAWLETVFKKMELRDHFEDYLDLGVSPWKIQYAAYPKSALERMAWNTKVQP